MENNENLLQNCMIWLTDISMFRARISKIRQRLQEARSNVDNAAGNEKYISIIQRIHIALNRLDSTETSILLCIKESTKIPTFNPFSKMTLGEWSENEMFKTMKNNYIRIVDLQKSLNDFLKDNVPTRSSSKVVKLENARNRDRGELDLHFN